MLKEWKIFDYFNALLMLMIMVVTAYPLIYVVSLSFSDNFSIAQNIVTFYPKGFNLEAYKYILRDDRIPRAYLNTIIYTSAGTFVNLLMTSIAAYPLSRKDFFGRKVLTKLIIVTMFFNGGMIPMYLVVYSLGLVDSIWALILPNAIWTYELLILKSFYESLPPSMYESAVIDGASEYRVLFQIIMPLSKAALASICLFFFMGHWNSFFNPLLYLNDMKKYPLQLILRDMMISSTIAETNIVNEFSKSTPEAMKNAVIVITMIPVMIVYPFAQKYFAKGVMLGAVKG